MLLRSACNADVSTMTGINQLFLTLKCPRSVPDLRLALSVNWQKSSILLLLPNWANFLHENFQFWQGTSWFLRDDDLQVWKGADSILGKQDLFLFLGKGEPCVQLWLFPINARLAAPLSFVWWTSNHYYSFSFQCSRVIVSPAKIHFWKIFSAHKQLGNMPSVVTNFVIVLNFSFLLGLLGPTMT